MCKLTINNKIHGGNESTVLQVRRNVYFKDILLHILFAIIYARRSLDKNPCNFFYNMKRKIH